MPIGRRDARGEAAGSCIGAGEHTPPRALGRVLESKLEKILVTAGRLPSAVRTGERVTTTTSTTTLTMSEGINHALVEALERPEPMMLLGQDIGAYGGTFGVTRGLWERFGDDVVRDGPLCESGTVGFAIGLAVTGVRAVCEIEFF